MLPKLLTAVPGEKSRALAQRLRAHESRNVTFVSEGFPIFWELAQGANVWDVDGNCFLDLTSAFGVATAGFACGYKQDTFSRQGAILEHAMGDVHPARLKVELCEQLSAVTYERWGAGTGKVILGNSGFEAVEAALKTAFLATQKRRVLAFTGAYHGVGFGSLTASGWELFKSPFRPLLADLADFVPYPRRAEDLAALETQMSEILARKDTGVILVEPTLGRGGEVIPPPGFLHLLRRLADQYGALLALDEIYTGFFRTGKWFACEYEGVVPDLICLGKALSGAYPLSACVGKAALMDIWPESTGEALHTSTFLGNPVGCALALGSLEFWRGRDWEAEIRQIADLWREALMPLTKLPEVVEVRGRGLLWGVECHTPEIAGLLMTQGLQRGFILLGAGPDGRVLSLAPSVVLTAAEIAFAAKGIHDLIAVVAGPSVA